MMPQSISAAFVFILLAWSAFVHANEMHYGNPTRYVISGTDIYGNDAYEMTFDFERVKDRGDLVGLHIKIYDHELSVADEILKDVSYIHFDGIDLVNDAGIFGSYFYGRIPFGPVSKCRKARRNRLTKHLHISDLGKMDGGGISVKTQDPCNE